MLLMLEAHYNQHKAKWGVATEMAFKLELEGLPDGISGALGDRVRRSERELITYAAIPRIAESILRYRERTAPQPKAEPYIPTLPERVPALLLHGAREYFESQGKPMQERHEKQLLGWYERAVSKERGDVPAVTQTMPGTYTRPTEAVDQYGFKPDEDPFAEEA